MAIEIRKKNALNIWEHILEDGRGLIISNAHCKLQGGVFELTEPNGQDNIKALIADIEIYDETDLGTKETFTSSVAIMTRLKELEYPNFSTALGGSGAGTTPTTVDGGEIQ